MTDENPFLQLNINKSLEWFQTESYEAYTHRLAVLKTVAEWDEVKYRERDDARSQAEARTRIRLIDEAFQAAFDKHINSYAAGCEEEDEVDDSVSVHSPVSYG